MVDPRSPSYWDANIFLAYIEGTPEQVEAIERLIGFLEPAAQPSVVTSVLSIVEVAFIEEDKRRQRLGPAFDSTFAALWTDPLIRLINLDPAIATSARQLVRDSLPTGPRINPPDATHLATARSAGVAVFHTYDVALHRHSGRYGFDIVRP